VIGRLSGVLVQKQVEAVILEANGVGWEVHCPLSVLERLPPEGQVCVLSIHTHVREDQIALYGFQTAEERALFRLLISVTGVGPKLAMACLGGLRAEDFARAIVGEDLKRLSSIPGVGKRTAERLVLELKDKLGRVTLTTPTTKASAGSAHLADLQSALTNLGYRPRDIELLVGGLEKEAATLGFEALLREALKRLTGQHSP
jgi:Holliday junction DNA helicase RuvA